jgi:hypothetical protein
MLAKFIVTSQRRFWLISSLAWISAAFSENLPVGSLSLFCLLPIYAIKLIVKY